MSDNRGRRPAEVVADNVRDYRVLRRHSQRQLADRMRQLGHRWHQQSASGVEAGTRPVTTDELVALALVLEVTVAGLLDPEGADGRGTDGYYLGDIDYPDGATYLPLPYSRLVALSEVPLGFDGVGVELPLASPYLDAYRRHGIEVDRGGQS